MSKKKKRKIYAVIILIAVLLFVLFVLFLGNNEKFDFIPSVIGSGSVLAIYAVKHSGSKLVEWDGNSDDKNE